MRIFTVLLLTFICQIGYSQFEFGIKTGLSSMDLADKSIFIDKSDENVELSVLNAHYGFHIGLYTRVKIANIYVEPSFLLNSNSVDYNLNKHIFDTGIVKTIRTETYNNLDIPLLVGMKFAFLRVQAGPVAHIFLNSASELTAIKGYAQKFKDANYGIQAGLGLDIWNFRLDVNYETNLSKFGNHITVDGTDYEFDTRPGRIVASLGIRF